MKKSLLGAILVVVLLVYFIAITEAQVFSPPNPIRTLWENIGQNIFNKNPGNVGIGTEDPQQKLEVDGGIRLNTLEVKPVCGNKSVGTLWAESDEFGNSLEFCKVTYKQTSNGTLVIQSAVLPTPRMGLSCAEDSSTNKIYCFGGQFGTNLNNEITEYDPATDTLKIQSAILPSSRRAASCAEDSSTNKIYCFGGTTFGSSPIPEIVEYDPITDNVIIQSATLPFSTTATSCAEDSSTNKIYCFGGHTGNPNNFILEYDPATDTIITKSSVLPKKVYVNSCAEDSSTNKIYCFGGQGISTYYVDIVEYDPATDTIITKSSTLPSGSSGHSCVEDFLSHKIYCFGGYGSSNPLDRIVEYDPATDTMVIKSVTLPSPRNAFSCSIDSSTYNIYCFGGQPTQAPGGEIDEIIKYSPDVTQSIIYQWKTLA